MKIITNIPKIMEIDYTNILIIQSICIMFSILSTDRRQLLYILKSKKILFNVENRKLCIGEQS